MRDELLQDAEECREKALCYLGRPEATFLLRAAREFDRLAQTKADERYASNAVAAD